VTRSQFAERYQTKDEVGTAVPTFKSWTELRSGDRSCGAVGAARDHPGFMGTRQPAR
jgi:hypothetical protein